VKCYNDNTPAYDGENGAHAFNFVVVRTFDVVAVVCRMSFSYPQGLAQYFRASVILRLPLLHLLLYSFTPVLLVPMILAVFCFCQLATCFFCCLLLAVVSHFYGQLVFLSLFVVYFVGLLLVCALILYT